MTQTSSRNEARVSISSRYWFVAAVTVLGSSKPCSCHSRQPSTIHEKTPASSVLSLSGSLGSALEPSKRWVNGINLIRSQMASSVPLITGLLLVESHSLNSGLKSNGSAKRNRAVTVSSPVRFLTFDSASARPCSTSAAETRRAPLSAATSLPTPEYFLRRTV